MKQRIATFVLLIMSFSCGNFQNISPDQRKFDPKADGYVPDARTAIDVAKVILPNIYGKDVLKEIPFTAKLIGDSVWIVDGSVPKGTKGGAVHIEIRKSDCKILYVIHYK